MSPILESIGSVKGYGWGAFSSVGSYDSIASITTDGSASTYTFSSIPSNYKHLQVRLNTRGAGSANVYNSWFTLYVNGVRTGTSYSQADLYGNSSTVAAGLNYRNQANLQPFYNNGPDSPTNQFTASIVDIFNYTNTNMNKSIRVHNGATTSLGTTRLGTVLSNAAFYSTSAITSVSFLFNNGNIADCKLSLYGIKG